MKNNSLVPRLRKKFECLKLEEISGWRKDLGGSQQDLHPMTKFPALLKDRSDYHKQLIYPHWNLNPVSSEKIKHSSSKRKLEIFPLRGREEVLDYEKQAEFERVHGKNIIIGSVTTRSPPMATAAYTFISSKPDGEVGMRGSKSDRQGVGRKVVKNFVQFTIGGSESEENKVEKMIQFAIENNETEETSREQNKVEKNEILVDVLNNSTSRTASAIVFGSKKTMFDVYSSALRQGSVKNKNEAEKLVNDMLNKGVLVKDSQKSKLFMKKSEENQEFESLNSSVSSISPKFEPVFRSNNKRRDSLAYKSEIEHSSVLSRDEGFESLSTNLTSSIKKPQETIKRSLKLDLAERESKNSVKTAKDSENFKEEPEKSDKKRLKLKHYTEKKSNKINEKNLNTGVKVKDLAFIEIMDSDDDLMEKRSKSVVNFYENKSLVGSLDIVNQLKTMPDKESTSGVVVFQKANIPKPAELKPDDKIVSPKTPEKPKIQQIPKKTPKNIPDKSLKKKPKKKKPDPNPDKNIDEVKIPITKPQKTPEEPIPKEKIAERILAEYKKVPKKSSISLDVIHENPKKMDKKTSKTENLPQLKLGRRSSVETPKKEGQDFLSFKRSSMQNIESPSNLLKKRASALTPRSSLGFREVFPKDQKSLQKEPKDSKQVSSEYKDPKQLTKDLKQVQKDPTDQREDQSKILIRKPSNSDRSYKSSFSYRTEDFNDKSMSRSSSFKKNLVTPVMQIKAKKVRKPRKREDKEEESSQEISDYEESMESPVNLEKSKSHLKKKSIIYEIDQLDKNKESKGNKGNKENSSENLQKSNLSSQPSSLETDSDDLEFDLSQLMQNKNFSMNKFSFSPQVVFRFSQRMDRNTYLNVNDIEINEYNIDHDNFESYINKKRFINGANTVMGVYRSSNKLLEILDVDEFLPVQVHRKKLREFERIRKKDLILQARGKVVELSKKPKFTFSGLECGKVKKTKRPVQDKDIKDEDIIRSGGSLNVRDEVHLSERLYCRVKDVFNLESVSGINKNSADRIINSLKNSLSALEKSGKKINL